MSSFEYGDFAPHMQAIGVEDRSPSIAAEEFSNRLNFIR